MLFATLALATLGVMVLLAWYLRRVPEWPRCPRCGGAARGRGDVGRGWAASVVGRWTVAGSCPVCGWSGRLRRGPEPGVVRREVRTRGAP
jgi:hypothetical protein